MTCHVALDLRPMADSDRALVFDSWLRSYYKSRDGRGYPEVEAYYADYAPVVVSLIARSKVYIAALKAESDAVAGWAALEGETLHYVFVKRRWRELGIAKWLMTRLGLTDRAVTFSHRTRMCEPSWGAGVQDPPEIRIPESWQYRRFKIWPAKEAA